MKLLYCEGVKLFKQRAFHVLLILLVIVDFFFIIMNQGSQNISFKEKNIQQELIKQLDVKRPEEQRTWLKEETALYMLLQRYEMRYINDEDVTLDKKQQARYDTLDPSLINAYVLLYQDMLSYYERIDGYDEYINQVNDRLLSIQQGPMWNTYSNRKKQELLDQVQAYHDLKLSHMEPVHYQGVEAFAQNSMAAILSLIFMCGVCILVFYEDEHDMKELLLSTYHGHRMSVFVKLLFIGIVSFFGACLLQGMDYLFHLILYGSCNQHVAVQAIPSLYESPHAYALWQWVLLSIIKKAFCISMFSYFFSMLYRLCSGKILSILLFFSFLMVEAVTYEGIDTTSILSIFTYINIWRILYGVSLYLSTPIYYLYSVSLSLPNILFILCLMTGILCGGICVWKQPLSLPVMKHRSSFVLKNTSLFLQESFQLLWKQKGIFVLLLILLVCFGDFFKNYYDSASLRKQEHKIYEVYRPYLGKVDNDCIKRLENAKADMDAKEIRMEEARIAYQKGTSSLEEYQSIKQQYQDDILYRQTFTSLYNDWQQHPTYIAYVRGYRAWFALQEPTRNSRDAFLIMGSCILLLSGFFGKATQEEQLYQTTRYGHCVRKRAIWKNAVLYAVCLFFIVEGCAWLYFALLYPMGQSEAPLYLFHENVINFHFPLTPEMSIQQYGWMLVGSQILAMSTLIILCVFVSRYCKNRLIAIVILLAVLFLPAFLYLSGMEFIRYISLFDVLMGNLFLQKTFSWIKIIIFLCSDICMILLLNHDMKE